MTYYAVPDDWATEVPPFSRWVVATRKAPLSKLRSDEIVCAGVATEDDARRIAAGLNYHDYLARKVGAEEADQFVGNYSEAWEVNR